jgi:hypothetical protein
MVYVTLYINNGRSEKFRARLVHVFWPNQAHGVQHPRVWLPAATLEPGCRDAFPPPPPASPETLESSVSPEPGSRAASAGDGGREIWLGACRREKRRRTRES